MGNVGKLAADYLVKKLDAKNDKLYEDGKADLQLIMAFGTKIDNNSRIARDIDKNIAEIKSALSNIRSLIELSLKKG